MVGGFSYPLSQLNRTTQALRQPGSSIKPLTYLAALHRGLQPNTMVQDSPVTLPPIPGVTTHSWTPKNYDSSSAGTITLRRALENSKNLVTAQLLTGIDKDPTKSLELICDLALKAKIYSDCMKNYPFVLGAQALRMIDLAAFYAAIANEGNRVTPYAIESIEQTGGTVYRHQPAPPSIMASGDRVAFYQLRNILEGVVVRGTATSMKHLAGYVGGKTGTTDNENDAWFVGFTNDVTVAVWVGYDNQRGKRTLGQGGTGGSIAVPIVEPIIQATFTHVAPKTSLPPPSPEAARFVKAVPIDVTTGQPLSASARGAFQEYFRIDDKKRLRDTRYALVGRGRVMARGERPIDLDDRPQRPAAVAARPAMPPQYQYQMQPQVQSRHPRSLRELFGM
jgi:membrane carboxypeptidase/penicillin-binding protein